MGEHPRRFLAAQDAGMFQQDTTKYRDLALELGATDAKIIGSDEVIIDERVIARCYSPRCCYYGTNMNCPPLAPGIDEARKIVGRYDQGLSS